MAALLFSVCKSFFNYETLDTEKINVVNIIYLRQFTLREKNMDTVNKSKVVWFL